MAGITNRSPKAEKANQKKVQGRRADLLGRPGLNKADQDKSVESNRAGGHTLDRGVEKNTPGMDQKL